MPTNNNNNTLPDTLTQQHTHTHRRISTHAHSYMCTQPRTHAHAHTHTHTHTPMRTHTRTQQHNQPRSHVILLGSKCKNAAVPARPISSTQHSQHSHGSVLEHSARLTRHASWCRAMTTKWSRQPERTKPAGRQRLIQCATVSAHSSYRLEKVADLWRKSSRTRVLREHEDPLRVGRAVGAKSTRPCNADCRTPR